MNILVIGGGGREHALVWKLAQSPLVDKLYCAPGNAGIADNATCLPIGAMDFDKIEQACADHAIDFVVVGPDDPLAAGLVDRLENKAIKCFGPTAAAAQLEASKSFTKNLCRDYNIPTAASQTFTETAPAKAFLATLDAPYVIKADGLALGKGVIIAETLDEAEKAVDDMLSGSFGDAGQTIVIEEFLHGEEASFFALTDGQSILPLAGAQDHKRIGEGDTGPNTGGMGAYSPAPVLDDAMTTRVLNEIIEPTVRAMAQEGTPYKGVLYAGLMITKDGPKLIEYNARFGDPECQVLMMRLESDLLPALLAVADETLGNVTLEWSDAAAITVIMATDGYPDAYEKGSVIRGLDTAEQQTGCKIFHAGTKRAGEDIVANGGRVLNVTALGPSVTTAAATAYKAVELIDWPEGIYRRDIGYRAIERERTQKNMTDDDAVSKPPSEIVGEFLSAFTMLEAFSYYVFDLFEEDALSKHGHGISQFQSRVRFAQALLRSSGVITAKRIEDLFEKTLPLAKFRNDIAHNPVFYDIYKNAETGEHKIEGPVWRNPKRRGKKNADLKITESQIQRNTEEALGIYRELETLLIEAIDHRANSENFIDDR